MKPQSKPTMEKATETIKKRKSPFNQDPEVPESSSQNVDESVILDVAKTNPVEDKLKLTEKDPENPDPKKQKTESKPVDQYAVFSERRNLSVPPRILNSLRAAKIISPNRPLDERIMKTTFHELNLANLRTAITSLLTAVLYKCYHDDGTYIKTDAQTEMALVIPLTVDACMSALYSKLRTIHKQYGKYTSRFNSAPTYNKDIELPLPLAEAISQIGIFATSCAEHCSIQVPVYPEGIKNEGRANEDWQSFEYESTIQIYRDLGIPCQSIDSRVKLGSAWWTYFVKYECDMYSATMTLPPLHYSDHSATIASMFFNVDKDKKVLPLIKHTTDQGDYGQKLLLVQPGTQVRAFMAIIAKPDEDWNAGATLK